MPQLVITGCCIENGNFGLCFLTNRKILALFPIKQIKKKHYSCIAKHETEIDNTRITISIGKHDSEKLVEETE